MRIDVSCKYLERSDYIDTVLEKNFNKIERRLKIFHKDDPIHVSVHLEKNPHKEQYFCRTQVYLPARVVVAHEKGLTSSTAINKTFSALSKQLDKVKYKVEGHLRRR